MEGIKYPYLGKNTISGKTIVVFFIAPDTKCYHNERL